MGGQLKEVLMVLDFLHLLIMEAVPRDRLVS